MITCSSLFCFRPNRNSPQGSSVVGSRLSNSSDGLENNPGSIRLLVKGNLNVTGRPLLQAADVTAGNLGYPLDSTLFYPVLLYQHGFSDFQMGYASAMAIMLLLVAFAVTLVILLNARKWVHYAAGTGGR